MLTFVVVEDTRTAIVNFAQHFLTNKSMKDCQWILIDRTKGFDQPKKLADELFLQKYGKAIENFKNYGGQYVKVEEGTSLADCYNGVYDDIKGDYVCFTMQYVFYADKINDIIEDVISKNPDETVISTSFRLKDKTFKDYRTITDRSFIIEDLEKTNNIRLFLHACFIKKEVALSQKFRNICEEETATDYLMRLFLDKTTYVLANKVYTCYTKVLSRKSDKHYGCKEKTYYNESLEEIYKPLVEYYLNKNQKVPKWLGRYIYYQLYYRFYANLNLRNKYLLDEEETDKIFEYAKYFVQFVDDKTIVDNQTKQQLSLPFCLRNLFAYLKHDGNEAELDRKFSIKDGKLYFSQCGYEYDLSDHQDTKIKALNLRDGCLCIDFRFFTHLIYAYKPDAIYAMVNGKKVPVEHKDYYALDKVFGRTIEKSYCMYVQIPLKEILKDNSEIYFNLELDGQIITLPMFFHRAPSKFNNFCKNSYWIIDDTHILTYSDKKLIVKEVTAKTLMKREKDYVKEAVNYIKEHGEVKEKKTRDINRLKTLRKQYFKLRDEYKNRRVWIYFDKLFKAGDNGEYAFRYTYYNDPSIECYYVVNKSAPDYKRLKKEFGDRILVYGSDHCRLLGLLAEAIIATHPDIIEFLGYTPMMTSLMKDLFNPYLVCIAHGVTIQKNADYQNRLFDNTMFYTTSSKYEVSHIQHPCYGYEANEVALTGMARFDGLKNNDQKQILITPTWRRNLVGKAARNSTRSYSDAFKETDYYKIYNSLINDERIIETAQRTGYRVIFLLHPSMSTQIKDYDKNEFVDIIPASGKMSYEKILTESSLMITDYSGIHYDFGYQRKPVIYYQPKEIPMRFEEGGMKFSTMGFGPVCTEYEDAVRLICEYMDDECRMPAEFKQHADDFFAFDDFNNSERIHKAVLAWIADRKEKMKY